MRFGVTLVKVIGARTQPFRDIYHAMLRVSWLTMIVVLLLRLHSAVNALFAV